MNIKVIQAKRIVLENTVYYTGVLISVFFSLCVVTASVLMLAGAIFSILIPLIAFAISIIIIFLDITKENRIQVITGIIILFILLAAICLYLGGLYLDTSFDGQWHHQEGIIRIIKGWNPYATGYPLGDADPMFFVDHYAQGDALALSSIFVFFKHNIEVAKGLNFLLGICAFFLSVEALSLLFPERNKFQKLLLILLAFAIVLNPVAISQWFTFYLDGQLFYEGVIVASLIIINHYRQSMMLKAAIVFNIMFLINIKFTGIEYTGLICGAYVLFLLISKRWVTAIKFATISAMAVVLSLTIVGYGSYIKNLEYDNDLLYPIMGTSNITNFIAHDMGPKNFEPLNNFERFYYSMTALPVWSRYPLNSEQRTLFKISDVSYYQAYYRPDTEMNGFGIFFAELILLSIPGLIVIFFLRKDLTFRFFMWVAFILFLVPIFISPVSFIARYAPEAWLLPVIPILGLIFFRSKIAGGYSFILLVLLITNSVLISISIIESNAAESDLVSEQLSNLKKQDQLVMIHTVYSSFIERLSEHDIKFIRVNRLYPADSIPLELSYGMAYIKK